MSWILALLIYAAMQQANEWQAFAPATVQTVIVPYQADGQYAVACLVGCGDLEVRSPNYAALRFATQYEALVFYPTLRDGARPTPLGSP